MERLRGHAEWNCKKTVTTLLAKLTEGKYEIAKHIVDGNGKFMLMELIC